VIVFEYRFEGFNSWGNATSTGLRRASTSGSSRAGKCSNRRATRFRPRGGGSSCSSKNGSKLDGALYISDDVTGRIYQVTYSGGPFDASSITPCPSLTAPAGQVVVAPVNSGTIRTQDAKGI
jgi:hypothetical protein